MTLATARPRAVLLVTLGLLVVAGLLGADVGHHLRGLGIIDPGAESSRAAAVLDRHFPAGRPDLVLLVDAPAGADSLAAGSQGQALADRLAAEPSIGGVTSYWRGHSPALRSRDGRQALITAHIQAHDTATADQVFHRIAPRYQGRHGGVSVRLGGVTPIRDALQDIIAQDLVRAEAIALPITLVVLVWVFGSAVAALLPLGVGLIAIVGTGAVLRVIAAVTEVSIFAPNLTTALGLGLAIDYALFVVRRFREELETSPDPSTAILATLRTAGRTVVFSSLTIAAALAAMLVFPQYFLRSFAYAGVSVVVLAALAALLPLPAVLVLLGNRVNAWSLRRDLASAAAATERRWHRLAEAVMRRAPLFALVALVLLVLLGLPFRGVRFSTVDDRQLPATAGPRVVQQAVRDHFEGHATGEIDVVTHTAGSTADYARRLSLLPGVVRVGGPDGVFQHGLQAGPGDPAQRAAGWSRLVVLPSVEDVSPQSRDLVRAVRSAAAGHAVPGQVLVAGTAAELLDSQQAIRDRLGWALGIVVGVTLLVLLLMTGSLLLPVKAVVTNALSLTAMFGAVVWVFQDGHLSGPLAFTATGTIETTLPVLMFCLAFGLSMDYGVYLTSRVKEEYDRTGDNRAAVAHGLARTGSVITSAAAVLAIVLVAVGTSRVMNMKMLGLGVALAVLMDATLVRCLLVPSVMALAGHATWWAPAALKRLLRRYDLNNPAAPKPAQTAVEPGVGA